MEDLLKDIKHYFNNGVYGSKESVRSQLCYDILKELGWNTSSPEIVKPGFSVGNLRVDIALFNSKNPIIFIEVRAPGKINLAGEEQLFNYANLRSGIPMVVLTDGNEWHFFHSYGSGDYQDRKVKSLYLCQDDLLDCSNILKRYLKYENVKNEQAFIDLREDYQKIRQAIEVKIEIPNIWQDLVEQKDEILITLITEAVEEKCEFSPKKEDVINFLNNLEYQKIDDNSGITLPINKIQNNELSSGKISRKYLSSAAKYKINGKELSANNGRDVYLKILDYIINKYGDFEQLKLQKFNATSSHSRNLGNNGKGYHYSKNKIEIPRPDKQKDQLAKTRIWINICMSASGMEGKLKEVGNFYNSKIGHKILGEWGSGAEVEYSIPTRES